jgi:hypothetical protein
MSHNKTNLKIVSCTFSRHGNTIECTLVANPQFPDGFMDYAYTVTNIKPLIKCHFTEDSYIRPYMTIKAKAKCHKDDIFDEVRGKRIAESRAKLKAFNVLKRIYSGLERNLINHISKEITPLSLGCAGAVYTEISHIKKLTK